MDTVWYVVGLCGVFACGLIAGSFLPAYAKKKGENLATREDIAGITTKIETVKHDYASQLEKAKADLSALLTLHGYRYEKEYEVLSYLTECLVDLRDRAINLRPMVDYRDPNKPADQVKLERITRFNEAGQRLYQENEKKRPFFPSEIYQAIAGIIKLTLEESFDYSDTDPFQEGHFMTYWDNAAKNRTAITQAVDMAMELIRNRVTKWDELQGRAE